MKTHALAAIVTYILFSVPAAAAIITSVDRATFQASLSGTIGSQNFDSLANGDILGTLNGVTYGASTGQPLVTSAFLTSTGLNGLGRTGVGFFLDTDSATFTFSTAITAFAIDINTFANLPGDYFVTLDIGDVVTSLNEVFPGRGTGQFIGFVSNTAFTSVTLSASQLSISPNRTFTLDTLIFGDAAQVVNVPEPATILMFGLGVGGLALSRRRKAV
jgi:PEP-CTERM motif